MKIGFSLESPNRKPTMHQIQMFADLSCPFAYVVHAGWRAIRDDYAGKVELVHRSLALEYVNRQPTPKPTLDAELTVLMMEEPDIAYTPWSAPTSQWPVTILPAFEAVTCARRQSLALADDLAWAIRTAFFAESRCISMRYELLDIAAGMGLDFDQFERDFDSGVCRAEVINEARQGWEQIKVPGSPTWVLSDGTQVADFGFSSIDIAENGRLVVQQRGLSPADRTALIRTILEKQSSGS